MKWFRSNIRHGARLALFAMLVQFALTFGHTHWFAQAAPLAAASLQQTDGAKAVGSADLAAVQKQSPSAPDREQPGDDNCAICAIIAMAGTVLSATPPLLQLPQAIGREKLKSNSVAPRRQAASDQHTHMRTAPDWNQDHVI